MTACVSGHVTGYFAGGSFSWIVHLAKLNPNCHMNYSIIFTEISLIKVLVLSI